MHHPTYTSNRRGRINKKSQTTSMTPTWKSPYMIFYFLFFILWLDFLLIFFDKMYVIRVIPSVKTIYRTSSLHGCSVMVWHNNCTGNLIYKYVHKSTQTLRSKTRQCRDWQMWKLCNLCNNIEKDIWKLNLTFFSNIFNHHLL